MDRQIGNGNYQLVNNPGYGIDQVYSVKKMNQFAKLLFRFDLTESGPMLHKLQLTNLGYQ